jgi:Putative peptidoglycan binding domain
MPEEDAPTVISAQTGIHAESAADPADDWLSDASDLNWFDDPGGAPRPRPALQSGNAAAAPAHEGPPPVDDVIRRRRAIALLAGLAVIVAVVLVWLLVIDAGGSNTPAPTTPVTTPANTTPAESTTPPTTTTTTQGTTTTTTTPVTGSTTTVTLPAAGKMKPGDTSPEVKTLQEALNQLGTAQLKADGIYGPLTQQAVTSFQQANGLTVDGIVGTQTAAALNTALAAKG